MLNDYMEEREILYELRRMQDWNAFAESLLDQYDRRHDLTEKQWLAAERMIRKVRDTNERKAKLTRNADVSRIIDLLSNAKVKKPIFRAAGLSFSMANPNGKNAGAVYVIHPEHGYQGKIMDGAFQPSAGCSPASADAVVAVAKDPRGEAIKHGKMTGACSCCGRTLTDATSVEMGIGPICAEKWGL